MAQAERSASNEILAPRMYPIWGWGDGLSLSRAQLEDPANAGRIARQMAEKGAHVVSLGSVTWDRPLFGAVAKGVWEAGGLTTIHLPPSTNNVVDAVNAACSGATMMSRLKRVVFAVPDPKMGGLGGLYDVNAYPTINHSLEVEIGVMQAECLELLQRFFQGKREMGKGSI